MKKEEKKYDYETLFQKLLVVAKKRDPKREKDCLYLTEFLTVKIDGIVTSRRVVDIFKHFKIDIPATAIGYSEKRIGEGGAIRTTIMLFSNKTNDKNNKNDKKQSKQRVYAEL